MGNKLQDFDYQLPRELIARYPASKRSEARLLVLDRRTRRVEHRIFKDLPEYLQPGDLLVLNNTKVMPARIFGNKPTGGKVEGLLLKNLGGSVWEVLMKPNRRIKKGERILFGENGVCLKGEVLDEPRQNSGVRKISFQDENFQAKLSQIGRIPLPPYIDRPDEAVDRERYQTVFATKEGAVASPTAGLHFDKDLLEALCHKGIKICFVTLHVSYGTFRSVQIEDVSRHEMDEEEFEITGEAVNQLEKAVREKRRIVACGTTVVRVLETLARGVMGSARLRGLALADKPPLQRQKTCLFIYPPYQFKIVDALITNFHLPRSTLLMLVSAFAGRDLVFHAYQEAIRKRYRFYSYGDAMLIL